MRIKWLHLSDIHFSFKNYDSTLLRQDFLDRVRSLAESELFTHLFLSGDILNRNRGGDEDVSDTVAFILELIKAMGISFENVIIVPGNHDHDRDITIKLINDFYEDSQKCDERIETLPSDRIEELLKSFSNFEAVYEKLFSKKYYVEYSNPHQLIELDGLSIIRLNTAWLDIDSEREGILRCGKNQLLSLLNQNKDRLKKTLNIAIGHHPFESFSAEEKADMLDLFKRYNIGLYFCGHYHKPAINYFQDKDVLQIVCPGGYHNTFSNGGYVYGIIDTDSDFYKAEFYKWDKDNWYIESNLKGTDDRGIYYFNTGRFKHNHNIVAADFSIIGPHVPMRDLASSIGSDVFDTYVYPYSNLDGSSIDWNSHYLQIRDYASTIKNLSEKNNAVHLYPLAPIPMLIALGFELQQNSRITVHQRDRDSEQWVCSEKDEGIDCSITKVLNGQRVLVLRVSCSFYVQNSLIHDTLPNMDYDLIEVTASKVAGGYPLYRKDVLRIVKSIFDELNQVAMDYDAIHIFAAIPAGMAVEMGRRLLESVYCNVVTYQLDKRQYVRAIVINETEKKPDDTIPRKSNIIYIDEYNQSVTFIPILGDIACGEISAAITEADEYLPMPTSILGSGEHFIIRASGSSMIEAGIDDGDLVIIRSQESADDGQIIVAREGDNTTLKRIYHDATRKKIILRSENPAYEDQEFDSVEVQGIAIKVIKNL